MRYTDREMAVQIASAAAERGGRAYFVGGCVRDALLGRDQKDLDMEMHGLSPEMVEEILSGFGLWLEVGGCFGVYQLKGYRLDIAVPQRNHVIMPGIGTLAAATRRDLTCNALMEDVLSGEIIDHFGGRYDLEHGILRHCDDDTFAEDPLRVLRVARFSAELGFSVAEETMLLCRRLDLSALPKERIEGEVKKALLDSPRPSVFFEVLREMDQLDVWFPELKDLIGVEQNP
ncbi:MAG: CCA tRNA nucleotidyltransferase, partial [Firmicutes bacterium]|nr:CCA tRNA nucleotidyltransferase [Bacillota bacterium]